MELPEKAGKTIMKLFSKKHTTQPQESVESRLRSKILDYTKQERELTRQLFGELGVGRRRDFFCQDEGTWVWYEEWREGSHRRYMTTKYFIADDQISKTLNGGDKQPLEAEEMKNFVQAVIKYNSIVQSQLYS